MPATHPTVCDAERIATLRQRCLDRKNLIDRDRTVPVWESMTRSEGMPWQRRIGLRTRHLLERTRLAVDDLELLVGRLAPAPFGETSPEQLDTAQAYWNSLPPTGGQTGHCQLDYDELLTVGLDGIAGRIVDRMASAEDDAARITLQSFLDALAGLSAFIDRAADTAEAACTETTPPWRQTELSAMAAACRRVAHQPPRTFPEAIQLMWLAELGTMWGDFMSYAVPGHLDRHLARFYEDDLAAGRIDRKGALLLVESLYLLVNEYTPDGGAVSVMLGGRDADGVPVVNDLSYLSLEALRRTRLVYPTVGLCWHEQTPKDLTELAVELIAAGNANPAFFGDEVIQTGLQSYGVPPTESHHYINSTCVEITPCSSSNVWVASPYFNTCALLLEEIDAALDDPPPTFEAFLQRYLDRLSRPVAEGVDNQNLLRQRRQQNGGKPLQSVFTKDCIDRARDIDDGGARYNWVECSFVGLANLADSLYVIREDVYRRGNLTLADLRAILAQDFAGHDADLARIAHSYPKYGQGIDEVDDFVGQVVRFVIERCRRYRMHPDDSPFVPGAFVWTMHERLGRQTGATPDGRRAGAPFADGCGPAQGRETRGPTAAILSTTSWNHSAMIGGLAFNMKFGKALFAGGDGADRLKDLVLTYLRRGGFETQVNVTDRDALLAARANPEQYRDLVVRIGGYTDYFTRLSPEMQDEIVLRTEYQSV